MATKNKKYYAVRIGRNPDIYESWEDCKKQVSGFPNNAYKSFSTLKEAEDYMSADSAEQQQITFDIPDENTGLNIFVDGSFKDDQYTWAFAAYNGDELIHTANGIGEDIEALKHRNIAGEATAAVKAIEWAEANGIKPIVIHHDYIGLSTWANGEWKTNHEFTKAYAKFASGRLSWVRFNKVKGHSGVIGNILADKLASEARDQ